MRPHSLPRGAARHYGGLRSRGYALEATTCEPGYARLTAMIEATSTGPRSQWRWFACGALLLCALGTATLWLTGVPDFPRAIPPGGENTSSNSRFELVCLLVGTLFVALARWRWAPIAGALLGALFIVGFLAEPAGFGNLLGDSGATAAAGQAIQVAGELGALVAGSAAVAAGYRAPDAARSRTRRV